MPPLARPRAIRHPFLGNAQSAAVAPADALSGTLLTCVGVHDRRKKRPPKGIGEFFTLPGFRSIPARKRPQPRITKHSNAPTPPRTRVHRTEHQRPTAHCPLPTDRSLQAYPVDEKSALECALGIPCFNSEHFVGPRAGRFLPGRPPESLCRRTLVLVKLACSRRKAFELRLASQASHRRYHQCR
jgi:hypothetical protein